MNSKITWYFNRLRAMNMPEVGWRLQQKLIQKQERKIFGKKRISIGSAVFNGNLARLEFNPKNIGVNFENRHYGMNTEICLLKGPDCDKWPMIFSYDLDYKQRDDLGDARTNWEKNRHYDWALIAKAYYVSRDEKYLKVLIEKIEKWQQENSFMYGISWTSAMELAIRSINWMYTLAFVKTAGKNVDSLRIGIINMVDYLTKHYSRYSSANNHLLVEATAIGIAGFVFHHQPWKELALNLLTEELEKQNYADGVNKELSLHYQTFGMEAYLLLAHVSGENRWNEMIKKQCEYVVHSSWREKTICEFGDDDEGKILDLQGGDWRQWEWVLQIGSLITGTRYSRFKEVCENLFWLFTEEEIETIKKKPLYNATWSRCFKEGGNSFLRDKDDRILIGIDHAELGFGSIAAHGHADALSFQLFVDGKGVIIDPGTYIYHCDLEHRNAFRKTINHSTVCVEGKDQSEMLGPFLWGKRANCVLEGFVSNEDEDRIIVSHDGYNPVIHRRTFNWNKRHLRLEINDVVSDKNGKTVHWISTLMLGKDVEVVNQTHDSFDLKIDNTYIHISIDASIEKMQVEDAEMSIVYGVKEPSKAIRLYGNSKECSLKTEIKLQSNL